MNASFSKIGKFSDVPAFKHILPDPALGFFFGSVIHRLQFDISLIVCNLVKCLNRIKCSFCVSGFTRSLPWRWI